MHYVIDGHNLLHALRERFTATGGDGPRWRLARELDGVAADPSTRVTIVFDGRRDGGSDAAWQRPGLVVVYSPADMTADTVIERLVRDAKCRADICVVTNDRAERHCVEALGAEGMSCTNFLDWVDAMGERVRQQVRRRAEREGGQTIGDFFPDA